MIKANAEGRATTTYFTETQKIVGYMIFLSITLFEHTLCPLFAQKEEVMNSDVALIILTILFIIYIVIDRLADKTQQELIAMQGDLIGLQDRLITEQRQYICMLRRNQKDTWTLCTERLPEYRELVNVTTRDLRVKLAYLDSIQEDGTDDFWTMPLDDSNCALWNIVAWMPLPNPYKEEE